MKKRSITGLLAVSGFLLSATASNAALYHVYINTAALNNAPANANAPFYLDFQFSSGSAAEANNTITVSSFSFNGGIPTGAATTLGLASGSLTAGLTLQDSSGISELFQQFTAGTTSINFDFSSTTNVDPGLTPDQFSIAILDSSSGFLPQIGTNSPDNLSLVTETFDGSNGGLGTVNFYSGTGDYTGVAAIPEIGTPLLGALACGLGVLRRRRSA